MAGQFLALGINSGWICPDPGCEEVLNRGSKQYGGCEVSTGFLTLARLKATPVYKAINRSLGQSLLSLEKFHCVQRLDLMADGAHRDLN